MSIYRSLAKKAPVRSCWLTFSLRTFFLLLTIVGVWLGAQVKWIRDRHEVLSVSGYHEDGQAVLTPRPQAPWSIRVFGERGVSQVWLDPDTDQTEIERVQQLFPEATVDFDPWGPLVTKYIECDTADAETVLVVYLTIPMVMNDRAFTYPLRRKQMRKNDIAFGSASSFRGHGKTAEGRAFGCGVSTHPHTFTGSSLILDISADWTARDQTYGTFETALAITIGKEGSKKIDPNVKIRWAFEDPKAKKQ